MELRKFKGEFEDWLPFWEQFRVAVHENDALPIAVKFNFLSNALEGKAAATIAGLLPTADCYKEAIKILTDEYGSNENIIEKYIQKLMGMRLVQSAHDVKGLRYLYNEVSATMRTLTALKVPETKYELMVKSILLKSIPSSLRINYHRLTAQNNGESNGAEYIKTLLEFLKKEIEAIEKSLLSEKENKISESKRNHREQNYKATATALLSNAAPQRQYCVFCKNNSHNTRICKSKISLNDKRALLKREGRCFRCANKSHTSKFCKAQWIKCEQCSGRHITALCEKYKENNEVAEKNEDPSLSNPNSEKTTSLNVTHSKQSEIYLQTAKAIIASTNEERKYLSRIVMDNGSQRTFVTQALKDVLKLKKCGEQKMKIIPFGENIKKSSLYETVLLKIKSQYNDKVHNIAAVVVPTICNDALPVAGINENDLNLKGLNRADIKKCNEEVFPGINLLIGQDYYWTFNTDKCIILNNDLVAVDTFFGWTVQGCKNENKSEQMNCVLSISESIEESFDVSKFWSLESIGINNMEQTGSKIHTNVNIEMKNGRYRVNLPWKINKADISDNKSVALQRLRSLTTKLMQNNTLKEYDNQINEMLENKIIEKAPLKPRCESPVYYMPHKAVYRNDKTTTKIRIVFDASSSKQGMLSLNDHLSAGEDTVADLLSILLRFRSNPYAIVTDIEKAFLQIEIAPEDRDVHRFWWYDILPTQNKPLPSPIEYRMTRVTFGVTSSPFLLAATIKQHIENNKHKVGAVSELIKNSFYVDDLVLSVHSKSEAKFIAETATELMCAGNFIMKKWNSNDIDVFKGLLPENVANVCCQKVLGIKWCTTSDKISIDVESSLDYLQSLTPTKRNVLKAMAKIFDPIGMLGPYSMRIKIILQKVWKTRAEWDELLSTPLKEEFMEWQNELVDLRDFSINRCLNKNTNNDKTELHIFSDASIYAYGAVAYVRQIRDNAMFVEFMCSKNRIRPLKKASKEGDLTMPKLELTAALIAARLQRFILDSVATNFDSVSLWVDSTIALDWIKGRGKQLQPYVRTRVSEINSLTNVYDWKYCPGKLNPADLLTRGIKANVLVNSELWKHGQPWLMEIDVGDDTVMGLMAEITENEVFEQSEIKQPIMHLTNYSKINKLLRTTAWVLRFIERARKRPAHQVGIDLTYLELHDALTYWIKNEQANYLKDDLVSLTKKGVVAMQSNIFTLNPILSNGIIKMRTRFQIDDEISSTPIILPKASHLSVLLIKEAHQATLHGGVSAVLAHLRKKYWLIQGRQLIKKSLSQCVICKRLRGKSGSEPWTVIPANRVETTRPFETTGIDFAGPLYIVDQSGEGVNKVYILLFTCAAIRAIHLELLRDMTVKSCIEAFRRFIARYGVPMTVISDNARTFKRADMEFRKLESMMKSEEVQQFAAQKGIVWKFIPERAAWWGGFWERLVRTVKTALKATIGKARLTFDELYTVVKEVEGVTNSRPLTYISDDPTDLSPLSPSHFLNTAGLLIPADFETDGSQIAQAWKARQSVIKKYLQRWKTDYLGQLRSLHITKGKPIHSVKVDDVVLIHDEGKPRLQWKLGLVKDTHPGRDGKIRVCEVRLANGNIIRRPVQLLYPLEIGNAMPGGRM